jgi:hypothetical protein
MAWIGRRHGVAAAGILLALAASARAATLITPPLFTDNGNALACMITNVGKKPVDVTIEAINAAGTVIGSNATTIPPGNATNVSPATTFTTTFCRFTVKGGKKSVRAAACLRATANSPCGPALPAQ